MALELFDLLNAHGILPRAGGWLDQGEHERADILTITHEFNAVYDQVKRELEARRR